VVAFWRIVLARLLRIVAGSLALAGVLACGSCLLEFDPSLLDGAPSGGGGAGTGGTGGGAGCTDCSPDETCFHGRCVGEDAAVVVAAAGYHGGAIDGAGTLWMWGENSSSQLGIPGGMDSATPVMTGSGFSKLAAGPTNGFHSCAIATTGELYCWGSNGDGEIGNGGLEALAPTKIGAASDWMGIATGAASTCGIRAPGSLWCWGWNGNRRIGVDGIDTAYEPYPVTDTMDWTAVDLGSGFGCAIRADTTLWCWGANDVSQLARTGPDSLPAVVAEITSSWAQVSAGDAHACGRRLDGSIWCWGDDADGRLGVVATPGRPTQVGTAIGWRDISAGGRHTCAVHEDRSLHCWGSNELGQVGKTPSAAPFTEPTRVGDRNDWYDVECGASHTCGVVEDGSLYCFGSNGSYQLGIGDDGILFTQVPTQVLLE
jgi:alpha-tubulin suppressor-like RCC1 family protein